LSLLEVATVSHWYATSGDRPVLDDVSLEMTDSQVVAVVGESGCGKTTLGRLVAGLMPPTLGSLRFDGRDIWSLRGKERRAWRRAVQLVHQDPFASLNPGLTIASTLGAALVHHKLVSRRNLQEALLALLAQVGLDADPDFLRRYPHQLSGGQRQRVAIAAAVSLQPSLIVADEVTSMLDVSMRVAMLDLLASLGAEHNIAYLFISHDLGVVRYFAAGGRVMVMFFGVVVEEGPTEQIIFEPRHPYTYLLLEAVPVPDPDLARHRLDSGGSDMREGEPSDQGCVFSNRCPFAEERCHKERPSLVEGSTGHRVACFFPERVPNVSHLRGPSAEHDYGQAVAL